MRVLALIDMDSFYTQVEVKRDPSLKGQPVVVVQYNPYGDLRTLKPSDVRLFPDSNGSIIAASYEARKFGVKRNMMAQAAKKLCPELKIVQVPVAHGKADIGIYRDAGAQVINVLSSGAVCERASVDEAYLDVTAGAQQMLAAAMAAVKQDSGAQQDQGQGHMQQQQQQQQDQRLGGSEVEDVAQQQQQQQGGDSHGAGLGDNNSDDLGIIVDLPESVEGWHVAGMSPGAAGVSDWWQQPGKSQDDQLLAAGAVIVAQLRAAVAEQLGFSCSAGIAHTKILAKLGAGLNKPAQQTLVPAAAVEDLLKPLPISKLRALGGKFGEEIATSLGIQTVGELAAVPASRLEALVGEESAAWLARLAQGIDDLEVKPRTLPKSISCGKTFRGATAITGLSAVHKWLQELGKELQERIDSDRRDHQRLPSLLTVSIDTLPGGAGAAAGTGAAAAAAVAAAVGQNAAAAVAANGGRHTAQTWRAGAVNVSRSCGLRRPVAEVMAEDALKLVKKWARDRGSSWKIIGMFLNASNFVAAPTGASTLERFMAAAGQQQQQPPEQQQQQHASAAASSPSGAAGTKRTAAAAGFGSSSNRGRSSRGKRTYGDLRAFLGPSAAAAAGDAAGDAAGVAGESGDSALEPTASEPVDLQEQQEFVDLLAASQQQQQQPVEQQIMPSMTAAATAQRSSAVYVEQLAAHGFPQLDSPAAKQAAAATATAVGTGSNPAGQAKSVLTVLGRLAPGAASLGADPQQQQRQQEQWHNPVDAAQQPQLQQEQVQPAQPGRQVQQPQQPQQHQQQQQERLEAPADVEQPSVQSQPVVGSLHGWLGTQQQQSQQQQSQQQQQQQKAAQISAADSDFEFPIQQQEQLQQLPTTAAARFNQPAGSAGQSHADAGAAAADWQQPMLRMSDIDPSVLAELPYHMQVEIRRAAGGRVGNSSSGTGSVSKHGRGRGTKQQQKGQQAGSIAKYFGKSR